MNDESDFFNESRVARRKESAYTIAFVSGGPFRPQNHPVMPQGMREKNPNNRWSKNIAGKLPRLIARRGTKHIGFPVAFSYFSFYQSLVPVCFFSLCCNFHRNLSYTRIYVIHFSYKINLSFSFSFLLMQNLLIVKLI